MRAVSPTTAQTTCRFRKKEGSPNCSWARMALALYTMRTPRPTRISVMVKRTLSYSPRILARPPIGQPPHRRLEDPSSLFKLLKHVEAGTGRREEHHIHRGRIPGCSLDRLL